VDVESGTIKLLKMNMTHKSDGFDSTSSNAMQVDRLQAT
jgi:hypothetical protein